MATTTDDLMASFWNRTLPHLLRHSLLLSTIFILFEGALSALFLSPLFFWVIDLVLGLSGKAVVANFGIISFARSPAGIALIVLGLIGFILTSLLQASALAVINVRAISLQPSSVVGVGKAYSSRLRALLRTALALAGLTLLIVLPLLAIVGLTYWLLLSGADINFFLATKPPRFIAAVSIAGVLGLIGFIAWVIAQVRLIFVAPLIVFEQKSGIAALRASNAMVRGHSWRILRAQLLWISIGLGLLIIASLIVSILFNLLAPGPGASPAAITTVLALLTLVSIVLAVFQAVVPTFINAALAAYLYLDQRRRLGALASPEVPAGANANDHRLSNPKLRLGVGGAVAFFALAVSCLLGLGAQALLVRPNIAIMAHRAGAEGMPENSLVALRRTIEQHIATYAEIDVQETADGAVVVVHDSDLRRLANVDARVWNLTLAQIKQADIGRNVGPEFVGERIPTLEEFLDAAKGKVKLNIELKYDRDEPQLAGKVVELVRAKGMQNEVVISSLNEDALVQVRQIAPDFKIGLIYQLKLGSIERVDVDFLEPESSLINSDLIDTADARKWPVYAWTIDDADTARKMYDAGVNAVITNDPPIVQQALKERSALSDQELIMIRFRQLFE